MRLPSGADYEETAHTWVFVHAPRGGDLPLPDMLIFDYFENYPFVAIYKDAKHGRCSPPGVGPWGFYYAGQDETGAWGPLGYETIMMNDPDHQGISILLRPMVSTISARISPVYRPYRK